jgi:phenol/toluene 2-monooxygenase (NADH) P0/A0
VGIEGAPPPQGFDTTRTFVQVVERRADGFVEFRFSIGDPSLFVEMLLTEPAFEEFCSLNGAELVSGIGEPSADAEDDEWDWTLRDATHRRFK